MVCSLIVYLDKKNPAGKRREINSTALIAAAALPQREKHWPPGECH